MKTISSIVKKLVRKQLKHSILNQKNEWPATSTPIFYQPVRPKNTESEKQNLTSQE